jgi:hypothetical protein
MDFKRIFDSKLRLAIAIAAALLLIIGSFLSMEVRMVGIFLIFILICGAFSYFQGQFHIPIDLSPTFFFSIIISIRYGIFYPILFIPFAGFIPAMLAGGEIGIGAFMFMGSFVLVGIVAKLLIGSLGLITVGIIAAVLNLALGWFINSLQGSPGGFFFSVINALITVFYFISFGAAVMSIIG